MKYLLGIGFFLKKRYKKNPSVRVFLDDTFIDEFYIDENLESKRQWLSDPTHWIYEKQEWIWHFTYSGPKAQPLSKPRPLNRYGMDFCRRFRYYILDYQDLKNSSKLRFEIDNNDTNYTNGFMTRSTLIDLSKIFLIPCKYVNFFKKIEKQDLRLEFNEKIVPSMYCYNLDPKERNYQLTSTNIHSKKVKYPFEGYPFQFSCYWNDKVCQFPENVGGSGVLTVDIKQNQHGCIIFGHPEVDHPGVYDEKYDQWAFPISEKFFNFADRIDVDKYRYED